MIQHNKPTVGWREYCSIVPSLRKKWLGMGEKVAELENEFCKLFNLDEGLAVCVSSGSAALYMTLKAISPSKSKVFAPAYTCEAVRNAVLLAGNVPEYLDSGTANPNADYMNLKSGTIIGVSTFGIPAHFPSNSDCTLIEDISQALGSKTNNELIGLRGDAGVLSLSATKMITSGGQGGVIISRDRNFIEQIRDFRNFDARNDGISRFNFQMSDINASIGMAQLRQLNRFICKREDLFSIYSNFGLPLLKVSADLDYAAKYRAVLHVKNPNEIMEKLKSAGIATIEPFAKSEIPIQNNPRNALGWSEQLVSLPIYPSLSNKRAKKIAEIAIRAIHSK